MNKFFRILMIGTMVLTTACGTKNTKTEKPDAAEQENVSEKETEMIGGWMTVNEETLSQDAANALEKAVQEIDGASYEPVKLLATQVVAGINYAILCKITPVVPDATGSYHLVYVYEDPQGNAQILRIQDFIQMTDEEAVGGWSYVTDEESVTSGTDALEKALDGLTGVSYEKEAVIASQVVAGTNYLILCKGTTVTSEPQVSYHLVTVYEDLEGNASLTEVTELEYSISEETN